MDDEPVLSTVVPTTDPGTMRRVRELLSSNGLGWDADVEAMIIARVGCEVVACLGLAGNVLKCAAVRHDLRGLNLAARLVEEMHYLALERGRTHLFLYTKPANREIFEGCGFHLLAEVPDAALMENTPNGIARYAEELAVTRIDRPRVAGIVLNANPFTFGHAHLVSTAARECDFVHVFVVGQDASLFSTADRLALVRAGVGGLPGRDRVLVHPGSDYIVSGATFPSYFLKDAADVARAATGIDLQLFRNYVAPALGIRHRYVGTEPFSAITARYNADMDRWLTKARSPRPPIAVHTVERLQLGDGTVVSATLVRRLLGEGRFDALADLVPATTLDFIVDRYARQAAGAR